MTYENLKQPQNPFIESKKNYRKEKTKFLLEFTGYSVNSARSVILNDLKPKSFELASRKREIEIPVSEGAMHKFRKFRTFWDLPKLKRVENDKIILRQR